MLGTNLRRLNPSVDLPFFQVAQITLLATVLHKKPEKIAPLAAAMIFFLHCHLLVGGGGGGGITISCC